jgi:hypothetical protein
MEKSTTDKSTTDKSTCAYCDSSDHNIVDCPKDNDLDKILTSDENPHFEKCSLRILKKIATIVGVRSSYPKVQLALILQSTWAYKKKKRTEELEKVKRELATLHMNAQIEECPICMETIGQLGSSTTSCGHKFCTPCFVKTITRKNTCPMCRTDIMEKTEYAESMKHMPTTHSTDRLRTFVPPAHIRTFVPPANSRPDIYAYTFTEPIYPEEEEALYQYQVQEYQAPVTTHQAPVTTHQAPVTTHQAPVTTHQAPVTTHQAPVTTHQSDIYIDRSPTTMDLSSANLDECLEWLTTMPSAPPMPSSPTMPTSLRITPPSYNVIEALGIYSQQYNMGANANNNLIP